MEEITSILIIIFQPRYQPIHCNFLALLGTLIRIFCSWSEFLLLLPEYPSGFLCLILYRYSPLSVM